MQLQEIIPWGRSFDEYRRMFAFTPADLAGRILGCADGPAGFNATATRLGHSVISCDPLYALPPAQIEERFQASYETVISHTKENLGEFVWTDFRDPDDLGQRRLAAMREFLSDFPDGKARGRYVTASLPALPFPDNSFTLALVSHLLFLYSEQFDTAAHLAAFDELLRLAEEVRVFPLITLTRSWSPHVGPVIEHLCQNGFVVDVLATDYEFVRADDHAGNKMMRVRRPRRT